MIPQSQEGFWGRVRCSLLLNGLLTSIQRGLDLDGCSKKLCVNTCSKQKFAGIAKEKWEYEVMAFLGEAYGNKGVCLKMLCTPKPNGLADHCPYEKWLFHWEYTQHFQTNPKSIESQHNGHAKRVWFETRRPVTESIKTQNMRFLYNRTEASGQVCCC